MNVVSMRICDNYYMFSQLYSYEIIIVIVLVFVFAEMWTIIINTLDSRPWL